MTLRTGFNQHPSGKEVGIQAIHSLSQLANSEYGQMTSLFKKSKEKTTIITTAARIKSMNILRKGYTVEGNNIILEIISKIKT